MAGTLNKVMLIGHTGDDVKMVYFEVWYKEIKRFKSTSFSRPRRFFRRYLLCSTPLLEIPHREAISLLLKFIRMSEHNLISLEVNAGYSSCIDCTKC